METTYLYRLPDSMRSQGSERLAKWQAEVVHNKSLPMCQLMISKGGKVVYNHTVGSVNAATATSEAYVDKEKRSIEERSRNVKEIPCKGNELYRIYSMTKPVTSVAIMQLLEDGKLLLSDPVSKYLGSSWKKKNMRVWDTSNEEKELATVPCTKTITILHLLTHTSGLSYGFDRYGIINKVDRQYHKKGLYAGQSQKSQWFETLEGFVNRLSSFPLCFQPGTAWMYGFNVDVLGRIVEVVSGMDLATYFKCYIFGPLGMTETGYFVPKEKRHRFTSVVKQAGQPFGMLALGKGKANSGLCDISKLSGDADTKYRPRPHTKAFFEGGSGLVSTAEDYMKFSQMLLNGGSLHSKRILSSTSVQFMTRNHLFDASGRSCDITSLKPPLPGYSEVYSPGVGFGLGFSVVGNPAKSKQLCYPGTFSWGGAASTTFWIDPVNDICVVFMTALLFRDDYTFPLRPLLQSLVYSSLDDLEHRSKI